MPLSTGAHRAGRFLFGSSGRSIIHNYISACFDNVQQSRRWRAPASAAPWYLKKSLFSPAQGENRILWLWNVHAAATERSPPGPCPRMKSLEGVRSVGAVISEEIFVLTGTRGKPNINGCGGYMRLRRSAALQRSFFSVEDSSNRCRPMSGSCGFGNRKSEYVANVLVSRHR